MVKLQSYAMIPGAPWLYMAGIARNMTNLKKFQVSSFNTVLCVLEKYQANLYMPQEDFNKIQQELIERVKNDLDWIFKFNYELSESNEQYMSMSKSINSINLSTLSDAELIKIWDELNELKELTHVKGIITTWLLDEETQPFSNLLLDLIKTKNIYDEKLSKYFSTLTTPTEMSEVQKEEIYLCRMYTDKQGDLVDQDYVNFSNQYGWLNHRFLGPVKSAQEYKEQIKGIKNPQQKIIEEHKKISDLEVEQNRIEKELKLDEKQKQLFKLARNLVKMKDIRKSGQFLGSYINDKILREIARRKSLSFESLRQILPWEVEEVISGRAMLDNSEMKKRHDISCIYCTPDKYDFYSGQSANEFLKTLVFINSNDTNLQEIKGMCACPGFVKGIVRIINTVDQLDKIEAGDVMVSHATYPDLVPAMKKAGAIITEEGGLTCHAAIVSRELGKPCVIGTKTATRFLKDGDLVEVDGNSGTVRKI